jgi:hypothetical protein
LYGSLEVDVDAVVASEGSNWIKDWKKSGQVEVYVCIKTRKRVCTTLLRRSADREEYQIYFE